MNSSNDDNDVSGCSSCGNSSKVDDKEEVLQSSQPTPPSPKRAKTSSMATVMSPTNTTTGSTQTSSSSSGSVFGSVSSESAALMATMISNNDKDDSALDSSNNKEKNVIPAAFTFLHADFCPFANRVWIALLEKEEQHHQQQQNQTTTKTRLCNEILCCHFADPVKDKGTELLYSLGFKTIPVIIHNNQVLGKSSTLLVEYVDNLFSSSSLSDCTAFSSLKPSDPMMLFNMRSFMEKHDSFCDLFHTYLMNEDPSEEYELAEKFELILREIDSDLRRFENGPYICGQQFTLADIHIFGFIERTIVVIQHYKKKRDNYLYNTTEYYLRDTGNHRTWEINTITIDDDKKLHGPDFPNITCWYKTMIDRPSIKNYVIADRSQSSRDCMIFKAVERKEYLIEVYACYINGDVEISEINHAHHCQPGYNAF